MLRGKLHSRGERKRADYLLFHLKYLPLAVIEAKDNKHSVGAVLEPQDMRLPLVARVMC
jgi:type I restriction enzyme R subunit